jgi:Beta-L-arabinofuranosidase, GH127
MNIHFPPPLTAAKPGIPWSGRSLALDYYSRNCSRAARNFHSVRLFGFRVRISSRWNCSQNGFNSRRPELFQRFGSSFPFHCLRSFAKRSGSLLGRGPVQSKSWWRPVQSVTPADGKGMEARESGLESPGLEFRVRCSDLRRISELGFRIWFWLRQFRISGFAGLWTFATVVCGLLFGALPLHSEAAQVAPAIPIKATPFDLTEVRLLEGPFQRAMELDRQYLLSLDVDRLLHNFRVNAGLPSSAQPLGGWEEPKCEVRGHFVGHYLSACALIYASTGDERLKEKGNAVVAGLAECQQKIGTGYLSAFPETFFDRVEKQQRVWAPYYTLHKIYAGLLDMSVYCANQQALDTCKRFADWVIARNAPLSDEQMQRMLGNEHGGMNEVLANLYAITGEAKYLKIAQRFNHLAVLAPPPSARISSPASMPIPRSRNSSAPPGNTNSPDRTGSRPPPSSSGTRLSKSAPM